MRFCEKNADFPVFEVWSTVTYQTPRRAMAVERMLLRLAADLDAKAAARELPLAELFAERLCVPHAAALMDPCFGEMRRQGLLVVEPALGGFGAVALADVKVDPQRGTQLLETGKLPGRPMTERLIYAYDPIRGKLVGASTPEGQSLMPGAVKGEFTPGGQEMAASKPSTPRVDAKRFAGVDLAPAVREALTRERYDWLKEDTEIERVDAQLFSHVWKTRKVQVDLDLHGRVSVSVPGCKTTENWLRTLPAEELWQEILAPICGTQRRPGLPPAKLTATCTVQPLGSSSIADGDLGKAAIVVRPSQALPAYAEAPAGQLHVWLVKDSVGDGLTWSPHQRGATFVIGNADFDSEFVALVRRSTGQVELQTDHIAELHIQDLD